MGVSPGVDEKEGHGGVQFRVLGSLVVCRGDEVVTIGSRRQRRLLAALLVHAGRVVSMDALTDAVWGDQPPVEPRNAIQTYVARLREVLGEDAPLVTLSPGYALEVEPDQVDALRFEQLLAEARRRAQQPAVVQDLLHTALGLWRGPAYAEFADGVAHAEALRLGEQRLIAIEQRVAARLALGDAGVLIGELKAQVAEHPLRERFVELHMRALAKMDRQAEALAAYRGYRERLADETGLEVSPALRDLEDRILRGELAASGPVSLVQNDRRSPADARPGGPALPVMPTSLVGREREIAHTRVALDRHPVVTLTGTGGVGKTRLAAEVAGAVQRGGEGEVAWVDLAAVPDPGAVEYVIATAVGVDLFGGPQPRDALLGALAARALLLVLDNCEHLLDTLAPLVDQTQRRCPQVRVLATSRERLAVDGERVLAVPPLRTDVGDSAGNAVEAVTLFCERAGTVSAGLDLSDQLPLVVEVCQQLDGLPLAIELAAARTGALSLEALLAALREDGPAAVGLRRSSSGRHRDLWTVVDWSYRLLPPEEQRLFERLSVFAGPFGVDEAHAVCASEGQHRAVTIEQLAALAERSLLTRPLTGPGERAGRYRMLRTLRAFARQRLADRHAADEVAVRHATVLTEHAERAVGPPMTDEGRRWIEASLDDLRQIRRRAVLTGDVDLLARLVAALYGFDYWRPGAELIGWADDALAMEGIDDHPAAPQVHAAAAAAAWMRGDLERAGRLAGRGAELGAGPDDPARTLAFEALGDVATFEGRLDDAEAAFRERVRLARLAGDADGEALGLASAAATLAYAGRLSEAVMEADQASRAATRAGPVARAFARYIQGETRAETAPDDAVALVEEAAARASDCEAWFIEGVARLTAASVRGRHGDPTHAIPAFADLLRRWRRSGNWTQQWTTLRNLAELLVRVEADEPAVVIAAAAEVQQTAAPSFGAESDRLDHALATARARLGEERFEAALGRGRLMQRDEVVDLALAAIGDLPNRRTYELPRR